MRRRVRQVNVVWQTTEDQGREQYCLAKDIVLIVKGLGADRRGSIPIPPPPARIPPEYSVFGGCQTGGQ